MEKVVYWYGDLSASMEYHGELGVETCQHSWSTTQSWCGNLDTLMEYHEELVRVDTLMEYREGSR